MSDKVAEFLKELAPMKESWFWHQFIARLMNKNEGTNHTRSNLKSNSLSGQFSNDVHNDNGFLMTNKQFHKNGNNKNKEFDCNPPVLVQPQHSCNDDNQRRRISQNDEPLMMNMMDMRLNPPVPVYVKSSPVIRYPTIMSPTPPPLTPPPTPPKPKFYKLFQPCVYSPPPTTRIAPVVKKYTSTKTWISPNDNPLHRLIYKEKNDLGTASSTNHFEEEEDIFYCRFETTATLNYSEHHRHQEEIMGEETSTTATTTDTLNEDQPSFVLSSSSTITNANGNITQHHDQTPQSTSSSSTTKQTLEQQTLDASNTSTTEPTLTDADEQIEDNQVEQHPSLEPGSELPKDQETNKLENSNQEETKEEQKPIESEEQTIKEKVEESKEDLPECKTEQTEKVQAEESAKKIVHSKPPLKRSLSEPGSGQQQLNMLQKSPSRPIFTSSSFYDPSQHPTLEDQVKLCREIAKQLVSDDANEKSKGREMFERRVQKSAKWITENEDSFQNYTTSEEDYHERTITDGPLNLRLLLDPRHVENINTVQGVNEHIIATQEAKTRDTCKTIVHDLTSPEVNPNRGNALFAKRVQKSEEWIVDDVAETVIDCARDRLFRNVKQQYQQPPQQYIGYSNPAWSTQSSPIPPPTSRLHIPGPVFTPVNVWSPLSSRPSSSMSMMSQFKDFNARPKPFCRAY